MAKLRIGVPIDYESFNMHTGGSFSYATQLIAAIDKYSFSDQLELFFIDYSGKAKLTLQKELISFHPFKKFRLADYWRKIMIELLKPFRNQFLGKLYHALENKHAEKRSEYIKEQLIQNNIHALLYVKPDGVDVNFPFITIHWDIGHRSTYMFPEFSESFQSREVYYNSVLNRALYILTETETGKKELVNYANISADRIGVVPMFPGAIIRENVPLQLQEELLTKFKLTKDQFFIYPAQFWPHKNHILLIEAMEKVAQIHPKIKLILTGSNKGNLSYITSCINERKLNDSIQIMGFVSNEELFTFYKNAIALVMPTYLGPSNMPPLEAANLGCPVLLSDLEGHREMMGDYATYFDPTNVEDLSSKLLASIDGQKGNNEFDNRLFSIENALSAIETALLKVKPIRSTWGHL